MPNRFENRRSLLLAALLALLAAGTLCVWGVAAAGLSINSPALEAAIQAFNETRAQDAQGDGSGNGDVNISDPGDGTIPGGDTGNGDNGGDDDGGDTGGGDGDTGGNGGGTGDGSSNCLLGILCLNVDADVDANLGDQPGGLNIGGLHIDANANANDDVIADVDANAASQDGSRCFLNLICLTARADADLATNEALDLDAIVDVDADVDDDIHADVDVDADLGRSNNPANPGLLDGLLDLFIDVN